MSLGNTLGARQSVGTALARAGRRRSRGARHVIVFSAAAAGLATILAAPAHGAAITTSWAAPTSGNWIDGAKWTAGMPNNAGANTFDAVIAATGSPYTVSLNAPSSTFTVNSLSLASPAATFDHSNGTLTVNGAMNISAGTYNLNGGLFSTGTINVSDSGTLAFGPNGGMLTNGAVVNGDISLSTFNSRARFAGGSRFTGNAAVTGSNAILNFESDATINAGQTVLLDASGASVGVSRNTSTGIDSTLTVAAGALVHGRGSVTSGNVTGGSTNAIVNNGTIAADVASQSLTVNPNVFTNNASVQSLNGATLTMSGGTLTNNGSITSTNSALAITASNWTNSAGKAISVTGGTFTTGGTWSNAGQFTLNNATTNFGGTFTTAGLNLASLSRTGGEINITGTLDNSAATLPLSASTGSFRLAGGTIKGGTITRAGGAELIFTGSGGFLDGASVVGDITMGDFNSRVELRNGADFTGNATITGGNSILNYEYDATIGAGRTINLDASGVAIGVSRNGTIDSTLTVAPGATVRGRGSLNSGNYTGGSNNAIVNNGLVSADVASQTLTISPNNFTNNGTVQAVNNATLTISAGSWTNNGTVAVNGATASFSNSWSSPGTISLANNATLNMGGTFSTGGLNLGRIVRTAGASTINLTGTLDNTASTFALTAATGSFRLAGGTIKGGTITRSGGADLLFTGSGGYLDGGASLVGDMNLPDFNSRVELRNGADFTGDATISGSNSVINYEYDATIGAGRTINLAASAVALGIAKNLTANQPSTLTIAPGAMVRGRGAIDSGFYTGGTGNAVVNNGTISADVAGAALLIDPDVFTNNRSVRALNGASLTISSSNWSNAATGSISIDNAAGTFSGNWSNAGTVALANNATLTMGGTFTTAGMGLNKLVRTGSTTISLNGALNNTSSALVLTPQTGSIRLNGGTITGGSITRSGGADLVFTSTGGVLANVSIPGDVTLSDAQARVELRDGADFTGNASFATSSSQINYEYDATIGAGRTFNMDQPNAQLSVSRNRATSTDSTLTIAPGATVRGRGSLTSGAVTGGSNNRIVNNGLVSADVSNGLLTVNPNAFTNNGTLRATAGGTLSVSANGFTNGPAGVLQATAGGKLNITHLDGSNLNASSADGANSVMDLNGTSYAINQPMAITNNATVYFRGGWTKSADINLGGRAIFAYPVTDPQTSPFNTLKAQVVSGYNGGAWNGPGINSAQAAANPSIYGVAIAEASVLFNNSGGGNFFGQSVDGTSVLVACLRLGDADMNGSVNLNDFNRLAANFGQTGKSWLDGDFNYDGTVNLQDFNRLAQNFGLSAGADGVVDRQDWSALSAAVPEPTALLLLGGVPALAGMRCSPRRQRRCERPTN